MATWLLCGEEGALRERRIVLNSVCGLIQRNASMAAYRIV